MLQRLCLASDGGSLGRSVETSGLCRERRCCDVDKRSRAGTKSPIREGPDLSRARVLRRTKNSKLKTGVDWSSSRSLVPGRSGRSRCE